MRLMIHLLKVFCTDFASVLKSIYQVGNVSVPKNPLQVSPLQCLIGSVLSFNPQCLGIIKTPKRGLDCRLNHLDLFSRIEQRLSQNSLSESTLWMLNAKLRIIILVMV